MIGAGIGGLTAAALLRDKVILLTKCFEKK
ncbi:hypothetical protein ACV56Z_14080 [Staphylococcus aureus]